jgi:hypothetical protein
MDEMVIRSKFMKMIIKKILRREIRKKLGIFVDIAIDELSVSIHEDKAHLHISLDGDMSTSDLEKIIFHGGSQK